MKADDIVNGSFLVLGGAKSGLAAARLLVRKGARRVAVADEKMAPDSEAAAAIARMGAEVILGSEACLSAAERWPWLIKSPGIPPSHPVVQAARSAGARIIGELEVGWAALPPGVRILAITGTNGKTTTTAWAADLLRRGGIQAEAVGNIGRPMCDVLLDVELQPGAVLVVEASSFQLEDIEDFRPNCAVLTNLSPDHLDRYASMAEYGAAKQRIYRNMRDEDLLIVNADDAGSAGFADGARCKVEAFSLTDASAAGTAAPAGLLTARAGGHTYELVYRDQLALPGKHNAENALAAALASAYFGPSADGLCTSLREFAGVEHRIEYVAEYRGVRYFNDSKATNLDSLEKALHSFDVPIVLIAGGKDKNSDYSTLSALVQSKVRHLVTLGQAAPLIETAWSSLVPSWERAASMSDAVARCAAAAKTGEVVLLSPACASFDMYNNFEERGRDFKACVQKLLTAP